MDGCGTWVRKEEQARFVVRTYSNIIRDISSVEAHEYGGPPCSISRGIRRNACESGASEAHIETTLQWHPRDLTLTLRDSQKRWFDLHSRGPLDLRPDSQQKRGMQGGGETSLGPSGA